jgi:hypothetical protein
VYSRQRSEAIGNEPVVQALRQGAQRDKGPASAHATPPFCPATPLHEGPIQHANRPHCCPPCRSELARYERALHEDFFTDLKTGQRDINRRVSSAQLAVRLSSGRPQGKQVCNS